MPGRLLEVPFPLRLTPFEQYMFLDDRPGYPMTCFFRMHFSGRFQRRTLEQAFSLAVERHPLLRAVVRRRGKGLWEWVASPQPPALRWVATEDADDIVTPIHLEEEPGLRVHVLQRGANTEWFVHLHHASCDAMGMLGFLEDLLVAYARAFGDNRPGVELRVRDPGTLARRGTFGLTPSALLKILPRQLVGLQGAWQFLGRHPVPLAPVLGRREASEPWRPGLSAGWLSARETADLRSSAAAAGSTLNDLMVRDWFLAAAEWRARHFFDLGKNWLRLSVPVNLRGPDDHALPAANVVSMVFLDRRQQDLADPESLLHGIRDEMGLIKRCGLGLTMVFTLGALRALGGLRRGPADTCSATAVLSNLGVIWARHPLAGTDGRLRCGDVVLERIDAAPPVRPQTYAAFCAGTYAGRLNISLHYDSQAIAPNKAEDLLRGYLARLQESAGGTSATVPACRAVA